MKKVIDFLSLLRQNNNRKWFEDNRQKYEEALSEFNDFAEQLISEVASFDPSVSGLTVKDTTYRIYRDIRFSPNKTPYKTYMGVYICRGGKKSGYAGYYFHVEPGAATPQEGSVITSGIYMPETVVTKSIRDEIYDNGAMLLEAVKKAKGFKLEQSNKLKRLPAGYDPDTEWEEYLKMKDFYVSRHIDNDWLLQKNLAQVAGKEFKKTYNLVQILNRAVEYAYEEMV